MATPSTLVFSSDAAKALVEKAGKAAQREKRAAEHFAAVQANEKAREESGENAVTKMQKKLDFLLWGIGTQFAVSETTGKMAEKLLDAAEEAKVLVDAGKPSTMPEASWVSFLESVEVAQGTGQRHKAAWADLNSIKEAAEARGDIVEIRDGEVVVLESATGSTLVRNFIIFGGVAALVGGAFWFWTKRRG